MIVLMGSTGYIGSVFKEYFIKNGISFCMPSRKELGLTNLTNYIRRNKGTFIINATGYVGKPNVEAAEDNKTECLLVNCTLVNKIRFIAEYLAIPWGHISSGCIFNGYDEVFDETSTPNFDFDTGSFYSGSKALSESMLENARKCYIWRIRIPFRNVDSPRNYISKMIQYDQHLDTPNSITNLDEFVAACYKCITNNIEYGIYNMVNTNPVSVSEFAPMINRYIDSNKKFNYLTLEDFDKIVSVPRSNCVLSNQKALDAGLVFSPVLESLETCMKNWKS